MAGLKPMVGTIKYPQRGAPAGPGGGRVARARLESDRPGGSESVTRTTDGAAGRMGSGSAAKGARRPASRERQGQRPQATDIMMIPDGVGLRVSGEERTPSPPHWQCRRPRQRQQRRRMGRRRTIVSRDS
jgi:hypothetical protein